MCRISGGWVLRFQVVTGMAIAHQGPQKCLDFRLILQKQGQKIVVGLGNSPDDEYGVELAKRGYVCLAPAYPLLANYQPDVKALGYQSGTMKAIRDNMRGLDLLESLTFVKRGRFGAIGHSLGGHNAIFTAVFDERIKVVVSSCGFDSFQDYMNGNIKGWTSERYMPRLLGYPLSGLPFDFYEVIGALAGRVGGPGGQQSDRQIRAQRQGRSGQGIHLRLPEPDHRGPAELRRQKLAGCCSLGLAACRSRLPPWSLMGCSTHRA